MQSDELRCRSTSVSFELFDFSFALSHKKQTNMAIQTTFIHQSIPAVPVQFKQSVRNETYFRLSLA